MHEPILVIRLASLQEERHCTVPSHVLFPQLAGIVNRYVEDRVLAQPPADKKDLFLAPYYGWLVEIEQALARGLAGIGRRSVCLHPAPSLRQLLFQSPGINGRNRQYDFAYFHQNFARFFNFAIVRQLLSWRANNG